LTIIKVASVLIIEIVLPSPWLGWSGSTLTLVVLILVLRVVLVFDVGFHLVEVGITHRNILTLDDVDVKVTLTDALKSDSVTLLNDWF